MPTAFEAAEAFQRAGRKWTELSQQTGAPPGALAPLIQLDAQRIQRGSQPYSGNESLVMLMSAMRGGRVTPDPEQGFFSRLAGDVRMLAGSIHRLPGAMVSEAGEFLENPLAALDAALQPDASISERIHDIATSPGVRMMPGAFVAEGLTPQTPEQEGMLSKHPLFTLLDILPYANRASKAVTRPIVRAKGGLVAPSTQVETARYISRRAPELNRDPWRRLYSMKKVVDSETGKELHFEHVGPDEFDFQLVDPDGNFVPPERHLEVPTAGAMGSGVLPDEVLDLAKPGKNMDQDMVRTAVQNNWLDPIEASRAFKSAGLDPATHNIGDLSPDAARAFVNALDDPLGLMDDYRDMLEMEGWKRVRQVELGKDGGQLVREYQLRGDVSAHPGIGVGGLIGEGVRAGQQAIVDRFPRAARWTPSNLADRVLGVGARSRAASELVAVADRRFKRVFGEESKAIINKLSEFGVDNDRMRRIIRLAEEGAPGWFDRLSENEAAMLRAYSEIAKGFEEAATVPWGEEATRTRKLFTWDGEVYSIHDSPTLWTTLQNLYRTWDQLDAPDLPDARYEYLLAKRERLHEKARKLTERTPPARFKPLLGRELRAQLLKISELAELDVPESAFETLLREVVAPGAIKIPGLSDDVIRKVAGDVKRSWQGFRERGYDPMFIHHATDEGIRQMRYPRVLPDRTPDPTQVRKRSLDLKPWADDLSIALSHQQFEFLREEYAHQLLEEFEATNLVRRSEDVMQEARELTEWRLANLDEITDPVDRELFAQDYSREVTRVMQRDYDSFTPDALFPFERVSMEAAPGLVMHKSVRRVIDKMRAGPSRLERLMDKPMNAFRVSVLAASPAYYVAQVFGDNLMMMARTGPDALKFYPEALRMMREGTLPPELSRGLAEVPPEIQAWNFQTGRTLGRMYEKLQQSKGYQPISEGWEKVSGEKLTSIWQLSEFVNDSARAVAYLYGKSKAERGGLSPSGATRAGLELVNKVFQNWDTMTPFERTTVRAIMPFYSWTRYVMRYALTYPFDHPVRAAVTMNFARNEMGDWEAGGMPERFMRMLFLGQPDEMGNVKQVSLGGPVPFHDLANYFTLAGFMSRLNPFLGAGLEALGIDPFNFTGEAFPQLEYDPESGQLVAARPSALRVFSRALIPQVGSIEDMFFASQDTKMLRETNPEAFKRRVLGQFGLRFIPTEVNVTQERAKAEVNRYRSFRSAMNAAEGGDVTGARGYSGLQELARRMQEAYGV